MKPPSQAHYEELIQAGVIAMPQASGSPKHQSPPKPQLLRGASNRSTVSTVSQMPVVEAAPPVPAEQLYAAKLRNDKRELLERIQNSLESLHGPCYFATLMSTFVANTTDHKLLHYGARGIIRCATNNLAKM